MDIQKIKQTARARLEASPCDPRRLAFVHTGVALGISVLLTVISYVVDRQIGNTGGLSGIGLRSVLSTIQTVMQGAAGLLLPFWELGFLAAALAIAQGSRFTPWILARGFQKWRSVLRLLLLQVIATVAIGLGCVYLSSMVFMMTPMAEPVIRILEPVLEQTAGNTDALLTLDEATMAAATEAMMPAVWIALILFALLMIPVGYRFRMARFVVVENERARGIGAVLAAMKLLRRRGFTFFRLDLQFWWYYALQCLLLAVGYADSLLLYAGVDLPLADGVSFFLFFFLQVAGQLVLLTRARPFVETTYAAFYEALKTEVPEEKPRPENFNWDQ